MKAWGLQVLVQACGYMGMLFGVAVLVCIMVPWPRPMSPALAPIFVWERCQVPCFMGIDDTTDVRWALNHLRHHPWVAQVEASSFRNETSITLHLASSAPEFLKGAHMTYHVGEGYAFWETHLNMEEVALAEIVAAAGEPDHHYATPYPYNLPTTHLIVASRYRSKHIWLYFTFDCQANRTALSQSPTTFDWPRFGIDPTGTVLVHDLDALLALC